MCIEFRQSLHISPRLGFLFNFNIEIMNNNNSNIQASTNIFYILTPKTRISSNWSVEDVSLLMSECVYICVCLGTSRRGYLAECVVKRANGCLASRSIAKWREQLHLAAISYYNSFFSLSLLWYLHSFGSRFPYPTPTRYPPIGLYCHLCMFFFIFISLPLFDSHSTFWFHSKIFQFVHSISVNKKNV